MAHKRVLEDMREDCGCANTKYCPLDALLKSMGDRLLEQHKCVEKHKYELGSRLKRDVDWSEAYKSWVDEGYAKKFSDVYSDDKSFRQIWKEIQQVH